MKRMSFVGVGLLAVVLLAGGCRSTDAAASAEENGVAAERKEPRRVPMTPDVDWDGLNGLQKCTAAVGAVPGCLAAAVYNTYFWVTGQ